MRLDIRRIGAIKKGDAVVGNRTRVKVVKNKVAPPFREAEFDILYGEGISIEGELIDHGVEAGIIDKSGAWLSYGDERIGQGRENAKDFLRENPEIYKDIHTKLLAHFNVGAAARIEVVEPAAKDEGKDGDSGTPKAVAAKGSTRNTQARA